MPFIGQEPITGAFHKLDAITTSSTNTYNLLLNGGAYSPASANHLMVSLNGVIQSPGSSFTISGSQITFVPSSGTLSSSDSIDFIMAYGDVLNIGTPSDGSVNTNQLANNAVTMDKLATSGTLPALNGSALTNLPVQGAMTLIGLYSPSSNVATMDITLSASAHDYYKIFGWLDNTAAGDNAWFRFLNSAGNSVGGGSDYHYSRIKAENAAVAATTDNAHGYIDWSPTLGNSSNRLGIGFEMTVGPCNSTYYPVQMHGQSFLHDESSYASLNLFGGGFVEKKGGDGNFGGVRFFFSSGNVDQNSFVYVYGMNKTG